MDKEISPEKKVTKVNVGHCGIYLQRPINIRDWGHEITQKHDFIMTTECPLKIETNFMFVSLLIGQIEINLEPEVARKLAFILYGQAKEHERLKKEFEEHSENLSRELGL